MGGSRKRAAGKGSADSVLGAGTAWRVYLVVGLLVVLCYFLLSPGPLALNVTYDAVGMSCVVAIVVGVRRHRPAWPAAWYLFCFGVALSVVGDEIWTVQEGFLGMEVSFPSVADAFYLGGYPFMAAGLLLFVRSRTAGGDRAAFVDTAIVTVGGGVLVWVFLVAPYALDASLSPVERLVSAAYPLADVLLLAAAARLVFAPGGRSASGYLLLAGIAALMVADFVFAVQSLYGTYEVGDPADAGWLLGYLLPGAAALHPAMRSLTEPAAEMWGTTARSRLVVLAAVALALPATLALRAAGDADRGALVLAGGTIVLFLLVLVRMEGLVRDRESASRMYERAAERERALRRAGARLVGAFSREEIHAVALDAILDLAGDGKTRASIAIGPPGRLEIVAASGYGAAEIAGTVFGARDLPEPFSQGFGGRANVEVRGEETVKMRGALGLAPETGTVLVSPLVGGGETLGAIAASTDYAFSEEMRDGFEMLGSQVSLALESVALAEDLHEKKSYEKFQTLVQNSSDIITLADAGGIILYQSPSMAWVLGHEPESRVGRNLLRTRLVHPEDLPRHNAAVTEAVREPGVGVAGSFRMLHRDGSWRCMEGTFRGLADEGGVRGVVVNSRDVTERVEAEEGLKEAEARYRALVEQVPAMVYVRDADTLETVYDSPRIETMLGYPRDACERDPGYRVGILHPDDRERVIAEEAAARDKSAFEQEYRVIAADGREVWVRDEAVLVRDAGGKARFWQGVISDVTERKALEGQLRHQALHDALTGLPNRTLLADRISHALARADRWDGGSVAVLFLDLDDFKMVNDSLGHQAGDRLLVEVAERLVGCVRPGDTVARLGGDEFAILLEGSADAGQPGEGVAGRMMEALRAPFALAGKGVFVRSSIGISRSTGSERAEDLLRNADVAMYTAKTRGKGRCESYEPGMHSEIVQRLELRADLGRAIERGEFVVHYQPIVSLAGELRTRGVEALVRWRHPKKGLILPGEFVPLAEETGDIVEIGDIVLEGACRQARAWQNPEGEPLILSVNLSARQFARPDLPGAISAILGKTGFDPRDLKLEITESVAMGDVDAALSILKRLKDLGVRVAIDDFGTGYSSLSYLSRFPVDALKIDRSFVGRLEEDPEGAAIVSATVDLARNLGLEVIAEGVETAAQLDLVSRLGCDLAQGFYLSRPLPPEEIDGRFAPRSRE